MNFYRRALWAAIQRIESLRLRLQRYQASLEAHRTNRPRLLTVNERIVPMLERDLQALDPVSDKADIFRARLQHHRKLVEFEQQSRSAQ